VAVIHKSRPPQTAICGTRVDGVQHETSMFWDAVTCAACISQKHADAGGRTSFKRSHRAEGENWID
jgi:hypothetical protein